MSSILKALKKLEQAKVEQAADQLEIDSEILGNSGGNNCHIPFPVFKGILPAALIFICGSVATYFYMNTLNRSDKKLQMSMEAEVPVIAMPQESTAVDFEKNPLYAANLYPTKKPVVTADKKLNEKTSSDTPVKSDNTSIVIEQPERQQPSLVEEVPLLQVDGIAFLPEGNESVAIVNGKKVTAGSFINGATVEEILKGSVQFRYDNEKIEVLLGRSNK